MNKLLLVDGNSIFHRSFHAIPPLQSPDGRLVNAVYGFVATLFGHMEKERPTHIAIAFDKGKKTFRHTVFTEYKATRKKSPEGLFEQMPLVKQALDLLTIPYYEHYDYEADDIIGTLSKKGEDAGYSNVILSSDLDTLQLVSPLTTVSSPQGFRQSRYYTPDAVVERFSIPPSKITHLKALKGDSSDNIPGVPSIGEKTAVKLLHQYGDLDGILANAAEIPGSIGKKLVEHKELALLSHHLATIVRDCVECPLPNEFVLCPEDAENLKSYFAELAFNTLIGKVDRFVRKPVVPEKVEMQQSLF